MTLSRPSSPADDLTPGRRSTRALQAIRRPEAVQYETRVRRRLTIPQIARTGRQSRRPRRFWNTPRASNYRPTSCHRSSTPAHCWTTFNRLLRWSDCRLQQQLDQDTTGLRRLSSKIHVRQFDSSEHVMNEHVLGIYTRAPWRTCVSSRVWFPGTREWSPGSHAVVYVRLVT